MPDVAQVLTAFRAELVAAALVRRPSDPPNGLPPMVVENVAGAPEPGAPAADALEGTAGEGVVLHLSHSLDITPVTGYAASHSATHVLDLRYRAKTNVDLRAAMALDRAIRGRLFRPETNYGYGFPLGGLPVIEVSIFGAFGRLGADPAGGFDSLAKYSVEVTP